MRCNDCSRLAEQKIPEFINYICVYCDKEYKRERWSMKLHKDECDECHREATIQYYAYQDMLEQIPQ